MSEPDAGSRPVYKSNSNKETITIVVTIVIVILLVIIVIIVISVLIIPGANYAQARYKQDIATIHKQGVLPTLEL